MCNDVWIGAYREMLENIDALINELNFYANKTNPIWPFGAFIINERGDIIIKAADCAHISPLYHSESLAIHMLVQSGYKKQGNLTLITNVEPDVLSQSTIYWANLVHQLAIQTVVYGATLADIQEIWPFGIKITAQEIIDKSINSDIKLVGPRCRQECNNLFLNAKMIPARDILSNNVEDFFEVSLA